MRAPPWAWTARKPVKHLYIAHHRIFGKLYEHSVHVACGAQATPNDATENSSQVTCKRCLATKQETIDKKIAQYVVEEVMDA